MHRLTPIALALAAAVAIGCGAQRSEVRDTPYVEQLRIQVTKARNAIEETRRTIAASRGAAYLPELYVRLAELLSEEARFHYLMAYEREQRSGKALHVPQVRFLKERALAIYRRTLREFPDTHLAPRILYNTGLEYRELGEYDKMRAALQRLVDSHPRSALAGDGLLILGDDHFDRNELDQASHYYLRVTKRPLSRVSGLAHYKQAWVHVNQGDCRRALQRFESALDAARTWESAPAPGPAQTAASSNPGLDVRREALIDLTYCYSRERKADDVVAYLRARAYSRGAYIAALARFADRYGVMGQTRGAIDVARELLALGPDDPARLDDARMLHGALIRAKEYDRVDRDVRLITRAALRHIRRVGVADETRTRIKDEFELYARDLATKAQEKMTATRGEGRAALADAVAGAYRAHLDAFPEAEQRVAMLENLGEVLSVRGDDFGAGRAYLEVADGSADGPGRSDALYDAVTHLQAALDRQGERSRLERVVARAGLRRAGSALLGVAGDTSQPAGLDPERARRVKFAIAQTWYDEGRYRDAIDRLTAVTYEYPGTTEGEAAVHLVLDSYSTLNDLLGLVTAGNRLLAPNSPLSPKLRAEIEPIVRAAEQQQLDELALSSAEVDGGDATAELEQFATRYQGTELGERALLNAFVAARTAGDSAALYRLADQIAAQYPKSEQLPAILATMARTAAARFELERAIQGYRRAADANESQRIALLVASATLSEQLGRADAARGMLEEAVAAAPKAAARALPAARLAELLERRGDTATTMRVLTPLADDGNPEVLARLGLAQLAQGRTDDAEMTLQRVLDAGASASDEAQARAHYGMAEILDRTLAGFEPGQDVQSMSELVTLVEVTEQSYLNAARQGSAEYTAASLGRLAAVTRRAASRLDAFTPPAGLGTAESEQIKAALAERAKGLRANAEQALAACAEQAWSHHVFSAPVRACLMGTPPADGQVRHEGVAPGGVDFHQAELEPLRQRLVKNPEDLEALRALGTAALDGGAPHVARLVFGRAARSGGGPVELNLLGIAALRAGDAAGALSAFSQAAEGGLEAARQNLAAALRQIGLPQAADEALKRRSEGREGGRRLDAPGGA